MSLSRFRGQIVLMIDILLIFTCNFILFFPSLLRDDIQLLNLVLHIGLLTVCVLVFQLCCAPTTASGAMRKAGSILRCWRA